MKHSHISEAKIVDWLLGMLPEQEKEDVSNHLKHCLECQRLLEAWKDMGLKETAQYEAPPLSHKERIWAQAEAQRQTADAARSPHGRRVDRRRFGRLPFRLAPFRFERRTDRFP
ncbi:anti-sigma factor family protein [Geobacillus zalihae]|uniref:anti-sigma factor family protein n=1 Tax=Geobacillus zalihae TaxID=213419 RepID=UPI001CC1D9D0|nr:zf-HC2 domain-containing protein [Geobacillus zalihae]